MQSLSDRFYGLLRWSERYTKTDMVYLAKNGFWLNAASILIALFSFVLYVAFAHFLPKEVYGTYQYLLSLAAIATTFTLTGMNSAVARAVAQGHEGSYLASIRLQMRWALIPTAGALVCAAYYALQGNGLLAIGLVLIAAATPLVTSLNTYSAFLVGKKDFKRLFFYNLVTNLVFYGSLVAAAAANPPALVLLAVNLGATTIGLYAVHRHLLCVYKPDASIGSETFAYGKHLSYMGVFTALINQLDNVLVFHYLGPVELALYSFATAIPDRAAGFLRFFSIASLPKFVERPDTDIRATIGPKLLRLAALALVSAAAYCFAAPLFFHVFFPQYADSIPYSAFYALSMVSTVGNVALTALTAKQRTRDLYIFNIVTPLIQLALQVYGILAYGLWGIIVAKTASAFVATGIAAALLVYGRAPRVSEPG